MHADTLFETCVDVLYVVGSSALHVSHSNTIDYTVLSFLSTSRNFLPVKSKWNKPNWFL